MKPSTFNTSKNERGATIMEAMFVLPILFCTVFFIVWYSRSMHESNMMNEAMYRAGKVASTVPNLDLSLISTDAEQNDNQKIKEFNRIWKANDLSYQAARGFLTSVGLFKDTNTKELLSLTKRVQRIKPDGTAFGSPRTVVGEVLALLPSECATYTDPTTRTAKRICNNKVLDPNYSETAELATSIKMSLQPQKILLKQYPIKIVAVVNRSSSIFNGGGGIKEFNFFIVREPIPAGPFSQEIETALGHENVGSGVPPDPLAYGAPRDEGGVVICSSSTNPVPTAVDLVFCSRTYIPDPNIPCEILPSCNPRPKIRP